MGNRSRVAILACLLSLTALGQDATLAIRGDVQTPLNLSMSDLARMPHEKVNFSEMGKPAISYEGVAVPEILKKAGVPLGKDLRGKALATYVLAKARDGYEVVFGLAEFDSEFGNERIIVADKADGKSLDQDHGPLRLVVANDKRAARSVRMLEALEIVRLEK